MTLQEYLVALEGNKYAYKELSMLQKLALTEEIELNLKSGLRFRTVTKVAYTVKALSKDGDSFIAYMESTGASYRYETSWLCMSVIDGRTKILSTLLNNKTENDGKEILRTETERVEQRELSGRAIKAEGSASVLTVGSGLNCYQAKGISLRS